MEESHNGMAKMVATQLDSENMLVRNYYLKTISFVGEREIQMSMKNNDKFIVIAWVIDNHLEVYQIDLSHQEFDNEANPIV
jgi:hypothetical protein